MNGLNFQVLPVFLWIVFILTASATKAQLHLNLVFKDKLGNRVSNALVCVGDDSLHYRPGTKSYYGSIPKDSMFTVCATADSCRSVSIKLFGRQADSNGNYYHEFSLPGLDDSTWNDGVQEVAYVYLPRYIAVIRDYRYEPLRDSLQLRNLQEAANPFLKLPGIDSGELDPNILYLATSNGKAFSRNASPELEWLRLHGVYAGISPDGRSIITNQLEIYFGTDDYKEREKFLNRFHIVTKTLSWGATILYAPDGLSYGIIDMLNEVNRHRNRYPVHVFIPSLIGGRIGGLPVNTRKRRKE